MSDFCEIENGECRTTTEGRKLVIRAITDDLAQDEGYVGSLRQYHIWDNELSPAANIAGYCSIEEGAHHSCEACRRMVDGVIKMREGGKKK